VANEDAGGLSVEALEDVIDWREQSHNAQAARAELAALVEAAGRNEGLIAALVHLADATNWWYYAFAEEWVGEGSAREHAAAVLGGYAAAPADAGPGAAVARDETAAKARAWDDLVAIAGGRHPRELCPPRLRPLLAALVAECEARAGGAGDKETG
jgi:hypothetical protein